MEMEASHKNPQKIWEQGPRDRSARYKSGQSFCRDRLSKIRCIMAENLYVQVPTLIFLSAEPIKVGKHDSQIGTLLDLNLVLR